MARVKIEEIIEHTDSDMRKALRDAVQESIPDAVFDEHELFRSFKRAVRRKFNTWKRVPDRFVETE